MNVLMLHSGSDLYGSGRVLVEVARALVARGHCCYVVLPDRGPLEERFRQVGAIPSVRELGVLRRKHGSPMGLLAVMWQVVAAVLSLRSMARARQIHLVYSNTTAVVVGGMVARLLRRPHLWHVHEIIASPALLARMLVWGLRHWTEKGIAVSVAVKNHVEKVGSATLPHMQVIYNGIDPEPFEHGDRASLRNALGLSGEAVVVGMIGRVHYWKGQGYFLRIAREILDRYPAARFLMAGDVFPGYESLYQELEALKKSLGIEDVVIDLGYREDTSTVLAAMDIFVLPSTLPDPLPTVVLEAMAASRPVVATAHGGSLEMVQDGITGVHIPWDDHRAAVTRMIPLLSDGSLRRQMGREGHARVVSEFGIRAFRQRIVAAVEETGGSRQ